MFHGWKYLSEADRQTILKGTRDGRAYGGPYHLELDWVDRCNARCFFCNSESIHNGESVPWDRAAQIIEEAHAEGLRSLRLSGGGEPLLHPNLPDLLDLLADRGLVLDNLNTNGTLLTDRVIEKLMGVRVNEVRLSLNFADADSYAKGMGLPAKFFDRVCEMAANLHAARRAAGNLSEFQVQFFVYKPSMHQIGQMYELGRRLGADKIVFRELWDIAPELYCTQKDVPAILDQMRAIIREDWRDGRVVSQLDSLGLSAKVAEIYTELREEFGEPPVVQNAPTDFSNRYCHVGYYTMTVTGAQSVYPCCFLLAEEKLPPLDTLKGKSVREVWYGERYRRFRQEMRDYQLLQRPVPFFNRRVKTLSPMCASHEKCPMTRGMCDEAFYEAAEAALGGERKRPGVQLWRLVNRAGRLLERKLPGKGRG